MNMPNLNTIRGRIDVPDVQGRDAFVDAATGTLDAQTWAQTALKNAAIASAAGRGEVLGKNQAAEHRENLQNAAMEAVLGEIQAHEATTGNPMTDDEIREYAGGLLYATAEQFTNRENTAFSSTWRGKFSRWFGGKSKIKQVVMAGVVPAAITTGAALTGVGALAGTAVAARYGISRLRGTAGGGDRDRTNRSQTLGGQTLEQTLAGENANAERIDNVVTAHQTDVATAGTTPLERQTVLATNIVNLATGSMEQLSNMDRRRARITKGIAVVSAAGGGVLRFTEAGQAIRDNLSIGTLTDKISWLGRAVGKAPSALGEIDSPIHTQNPIRYDDGWGIRNPFVDTGGAEEVDASGGGGGLPEATERAADQAADATSGGTGGLEDSGGGSEAGSDVELDVDDTHLDPQETAEDRVGVDVDERDVSADQLPETDAEVNPLTEADIPAGMRDEYDKIVAAFTVEDPSLEGAPPAVRQEARALLEEKARARALQIVTNEGGAGDDFRAWVTGASDSLGEDHGTPGADNVTELPSSESVIETHGLEPHDGSTNPGTGYLRGTVYDDMAKSTNEFAAAHGMPRLDFTELQHNPEFAHAYHSFVGDVLESPDNNLTWETARSMKPGQTVKVPAERMNAFMQEAARIMQQTAEDELEDGELPAAA